MTQPEARISQAILNALRRERVFAFKVHGGPTQVAGLPDILACVEGVYVGLEVKRPHTRGNVSERQAYIHGRIVQAGGVAEVVCSVSEALEVVAEVRRKVRRAGIPRGYWS